MSLMLRFWARLVVWTGLLYLTFTTVMIVSGQNVSEALARSAVWGGLALVLAAFPAGIAVARVTLPDAGFSWKPSGQLTLAAAVASVLMFVLAASAGPALVRALAPDRTTVDGEIDPTRLSLGDLRRELKAATAQARRDSSTEPVVRWSRANKLAWHYFSRTDSSVLPLLFAWVGVLVGFWSQLAPRADVRQAIHWLVGLFLVVTTYLAGENGYEMVVLHAGGPAGFAADFRLIVPSVLLAGLGFPALMTLWRRQIERAQT